MIVKIQNGVPKTFTVKDSDLLDMTVREFVKEKYGEDCIVMSYQGNKGTFIGGSPLEISIDPSELWDIGISAYIKKKLELKKAPVLVEIISEK